RRRTRSSRALSGFPLNMAARWRTILLSRRTETPGVNAMPVRFSCPGCRKKLKVADGGRGKHARCSRCGLRLVVPDEVGGSYPMARPAPPAADRAGEPLEPAGGARLRV